MAESTFGERLAEARRIKGETIEEVSDQLRIRPSIIHALETSNFAYMPHKGYTRNMVSSYARYLGLDSTRITEQFLREFHRYEAGPGSRAPAPRPLLTSPAGGYENSATPPRRSAANPVLGRAVGRGHTNSRQNSEAALRNAKQAANDEASAKAAAGHRRSQPRDDRETITAAKRNQGRGSYWGSADKRQADNQYQKHLRQAQGDDLHYQRQRSDSLSGRRQSAKSARQVRTNAYVGRPLRGSLLANIGSSLSGHPFLLIAGLVVAFLLVLVFWALIASNCSKQDLSEVPVGGSANSESGVSEEEIGANLPAISDQITEESRYGPFELIVEISEGSSWLQIEVDGRTPVGEVCAAPWQGNYTVSSKCRIEAGAPASVKVFRNGVEESLVVENGLGVLEMEVEQRPIVQNAQDAA